MGNNHQTFSISVTEGQRPVLRFGMSPILPAQRESITEDRRGLLETDAVLLSVSPILHRVPFQLHRDLRYLGRLTAKAFRGRV